jgi:hypothetical protein
VSNTPNVVFEYNRPDEIAECWDGVSDALYKSLWVATTRMARMSIQIDVENSSPCDAIGIDTVASVWDDFTKEEQVELNSLAANNS